MPVETSPEWLPPGWTCEFRFQKTGRKITQYVNWATGQKFCSKDDLIRYTKMESKKCDGKMPRPTADSQVNQVDTAVKEDERPEWLPKNWLMEVKTRKSGITTGKREKKYFDPSTRSKFSSKPQVLRFLNQAEQKAVIENSTVDDLPSGSTKEIMIKGNANGVQSNSAAVNANECPEWLPENWLMEVKTIKSGITTGRQCKIYIDPSTRLKFYSKLQVLRFLNQTEKKAVIENSTMDDLPSGSTKEVMIKGNANGVQSKSQLPTAKMKKVEHLTDRRQLVTGGETSDRSILSDLETETFKEGNPDKDYAEIGISTSPTLQIPPTEGSVYNASKRNPEAAEISSQSSMNSKDSGESKNKKELDLPSRVSNRLDCLEPEQVASGIEHVNPCQNEAIEVGDVLAKQPHILEIEKTGDTKSEEDTCLEFKKKTLSDGVLHENAADKGLVSTPPSCVLEEKNLGKTRKERKRRNTGTKTSSNSKKIKKLDLPHMFSKQLARLETEPVSNGVSTEIPIPNATRKSGKNEAKPPRVLVDEETRQLNVGNATLTNQASPDAVNPEINNISCHEDKTMLVEQPQMSGTQKGSDSKSEEEPLFCSDPCLAFAVKTLTGAIPLEDAINEGLVSFPVAHIQQHKNLADTRIEHSRCRKTLFNSTRSKKDGDLHQQSPKQVAGHASELVENCLSNEQILNFADRKCYDSKAIRNADLTSAELTEKSPQQLEIGQRIAYEATLFHDESSNKSKESCNIQTVSTQMNNENPVHGSAIPVWSSWSGPSFQSPFRTVAGSSPVNDSFAFQRNLPDHRLPTVYRSDTPSHVDSTRQPVMHQQFPLNPLFLPPAGNVSLPSSSTIGAQQSSKKGKRKYQKKVKS